MEGDAAAGMWTWEPNDPLATLAQPAGKAAAGAADASSSDLSLTLARRRWPDYHAGVQAGDSEQHHLHIPLLACPDPALRAAATSRLRALRMSDHGLVDCMLPPGLWGLHALTTLDVSRNRLAVLPPEIAQLAQLKLLDVSRNRLKQLPPELGQLTALETLHAQSNHLRPIARSLPLAELGGLSKLRVIDLRFNNKLKAAAGMLAQLLPTGCKAILAGPAPGEVAKTSRANGEAAGPAAASTPADRDATLLRSQLEPLSTPQLRRRLEFDFGVPMDPETTDREAVMVRLLEAYAAEGAAGRIVRPLSGALVLSEKMQAELLAELRGTDWAATIRERPGVRAEGYLTLQKPTLDTGDAGAGPAVDDDEPNKKKYRPMKRKARLAAEKHQRFARLSHLAHLAILEVDPTHAKEGYSAIAVSKGFVGSPHIDTYDVGPQYALALGTFSGGALCVESGARQLVRIDTKGRMAKFDGRFPHWVLPYEGERYSIIWFRTTGPPTPQTTAVFDD